VKKELIDVINSKGKILRTVSREEAHAKKLMHPIVRLLLMHDGKIYVQQRALDKETNPGKWEASCSGHVRHGETHERAMIREAREELGIRLQKKELFLIGYALLPKPHLTRTTVYVVANPHHKPTPHAEVNKGKWVKVTDLNKDVKKNPNKYTPGFRVVWKGMQS
jgi:isopentenyl-diphosphate delta-isomerase